MDTNLWEFKHKPKTFDEMILNESLKSKLEKCLVELPNMTLAGGPGVGKGTFMDILIQELKPEILKVNGSDETGVDGIRGRVKDFAGSGGFSDTLNIVYINEADRLSVHAMDMLRDLIEQVQDITRFILLCNHPERLTPELLSRCPLVMFPDPPLKEIAKKCINILKDEEIEYQTQDVINLVKGAYPDIRNTINSLKFNVIDGKLSSDINIIVVDEVYQEVLDAMLSRNPINVRKVLRSCPIDYTRLYNFLYNKLMTTDDEVFSNDPVAILHITESAYRDNLVAIKEVQFMNCYFKMLRDNAI